MIKRMRPQRTQRAQSQKGHIRESGVILSRRGEESRFLHYVQDKMLRLSPQDDAGKKPYERRTHWWRMRMP